MWYDYACRTSSWTPTADQAAQTSTAGTLEQEVQTEIEGLCRTVACCMGKLIGIGKLLENIIQWVIYVLEEGCIGENVLDTMYWRNLQKHVFSCSTMFVLNAAMLFFLVMAGWALTLQWMLWGQLPLLGHFELCALQLAQELWRQEAPSSRAGCKDFCTLCLQRVNWLLIMGWSLQGWRASSWAPSESSKAWTPENKTALVLEPLLSLNESCRASTAEMPGQSAPSTRSECIFQDVWVCPLLIWQDMAFCSQRLDKGWEAFRASQDHSVYVQPPLKFWEILGRSSAAKSSAKPPEPSQPPRTAYLLVLVPKFLLNSPPAVPGILQQHLRLLIKKAVILKP